MTTEGSHGHLSSVGCGPDVEETTAALVALAALPGIGPATLLRCHETGSAMAAWSAAVAGHPERSPELAPVVKRAKPGVLNALAVAARAIDPPTHLAEHRAEGRQVLVRDQVGYPARLAADPAGPAVLFVEGDCSILDHRAVAIVGTRNATHLGRALAHELGAAMAEAGVAVVSGLALGIDGAAHRGCIDQDGSPVGVIASGLDVAYPRRHVDLHRSVAGTGLLISETVLGERPSAWRFPARNRIIAALAEAVVVVESRSVGGSMHTVDQALDRGIPVLAVPGHPRAPAAAGTNDLIYDGAGIVRNPDDVLLALGLATAPPQPPDAVQRHAALTPVQRTVLEALGSSPASLAEIVNRCGGGLEDVSTALTELEAAGEVVRSSGWFEATSPVPTGPRS